jgi:hypothetical protein
VRASWPTCFGALGAVLVALLGNLVLAPNHLIYFLGNPQPLKIDTES